MMLSALLLSFGSNPKTFSSLSTPNRSGTLWPCSLTLGTPLPSAPSESGKASTTGPPVEGTHKKVEVLQQSPLPPGGCEQRWWGRRALPHVAPEISVGNGRTSFLHWGECSVLQQALFMLPRIFCLWEALTAVLESQVHFPGTSVSVQRTVTFVRILLPHKGSSVITSGGNQFQCWDQAIDTGFQRQLICLVCINYHKLLLSPHTLLPKHRQADAKAQLLLIWDQLF